ncbi:hypothetical protein [Bacillus toyonensis]|uniref:hypothetical protein n=1 Tax=Bacillus toyonensis TaxID=155322 RepID=UPI002E1DDBA6|nr:hypothetical protein [Bacillus toyonensis]
MNSNLTIIAELKNRNIPSDVKNNILPILEKNINRIEFVKNFVGLKDILYFEELEIGYFDYPFFLSVNCKNSKSTLTNKHENIASIYENAVTDSKEIVKQLQTFFEENNRTLYIDTVFKENILSNDDMWRVYHKMSEEKGKEPYEIMMKMYNYPEWYNVRFGDEVAIFENSLSLLKQLENIHLNNEIELLEAKINKALENDEVDELPILVKKLKKLKGQQHD